MLPNPRLLNSRTAPLGTRSHPRQARTDRGSLTVITGCMFSGKTTELIRRVEACPPGEALAVKHAIDTRYSESRIVSHAGKAIPAASVFEAAGILDLLDEPTSLVAIDEGHFFDAALIEVLERLTLRGFDVVVAALQPDSWARPFPVVEQLCARADDSIIEIAVCARCRRPADRTQRLTPVINGQMVVDPSNYEPRCRTCWRPPPV